MKQTIIHIGFPKTGTTFLQKYLDLHPAVYHNRKRFESYYKTGKIDDKIVIKNIEETTDILSEELLSVWHGDDSQENIRTYNLNYDILKQKKEVAENLKALFPNAKILITVRGYSSLIKSLYSQYLFGGGTRSVTYFLKNSQEMIIQLFNYDYVIYTYQEIFGKENIYIIPFEFLVDSPNNYLIYIENTFQIQHFDFSPEKIHHSVSKKGTLIIRCMNILAHLYFLFLPQKERKQHFLNYLNWLYTIKEKKKKTFTAGNKITIPEEQMLTEQFQNNSKSINFKDELKKYNIYYK